jgi:Flp pilus assembly protein TadD
VDWINKSRLLWDGKNYTDPKKAVEYLNNAIKLQTNDAETYDQRGIAYAQLGQLQLAIEDFNKTIILKPDSADAYNNRGYIYLIQGKYKLGCSDAQKACAGGVCKALAVVKDKGFCH